MIKISWFWIFFVGMYTLESDTFGEVKSFEQQPTSFFPTKIWANLYWVEIPRGVSGQKFQQVVCRLEFQCLHLFNFSPLCIFQCILKVWSWIPVHGWQQIPPQLRETADQLHGIIRLAQDGRLSCGLYGRPFTFPGNCRVALPYLPECGYTLFPRIVRYIHI